MASGSIYGTTSNQYIESCIDWTSTSSVASNTSSVTAKLFLRRTNTGYATEGSGTFSLYIGGQSRSAYVHLKIQSEWVQVMEFTASVSHSSDGTGSVAISASGGLSGTTLSSVSCSGAATLDTIPRASTLSAADGDIGDTVRVEIYRRSSSFTHSIAYHFGSLSGYIAEDGTASAAEVRLTAANIAFSLPESFLYQIPNSRSGICTLTCRTYSGSTQIGSESCTFTARVNEGKYRPIATITSVRDVNPATVELTRDDQTMVFRYSTARITGRAEARYGATLTACFVDGEPVTVQSDGTFSIDIQNFASDRYEVICRDSRGTENYDLMDADRDDYFPLALTATATRPDETSGNAILKIQASFWNGRFGSQRGYDNEMTVTAFLNGSSVFKDSGVNDLSKEISLTGLDYRKSYSVKVTAADYLVSKTVNLTLKAGVPVFDWGEDDFQFHVPVKMSGVELDYPVEQGTKDGWTYRKWSSGIAECWKRVAVDGAINTAWGSLYYGAAISSQSYPLAFTGVPTETVTVRSGGYAGWPYADPDWGVQTHYQSAGYAVLRPAATNDAVTWHYSIHVIGNWK